MRSSPVLAPRKIKSNHTLMQHFTGQGSVFFNNQRKHHANFSWKTPLMFAESVLDGLHEYLATH